MKAATPGSTAVCAEPAPRPTVSQVSASLPAPASRITVGLPATATLQPEPAATADVHQAGEITTRRDGRGGGWRGLGQGWDRHAEQQDEQSDEAAGEGGERAHGDSLRAEVAGSASV